MRIREIASGLQFPEGPVALADGSVLLVEIARGTVTRVTVDGRTQVVAEPGGGPNGLAMGPDGNVFICNNGGFMWHRDGDGGLRPVGQAADYSGGRIERLSLATGQVERVYDRVKTAAGADIALRGPNDLVFDAHGGFWFTDLGKARPRDMDRGGVYYGRADGSLLREVVHPVTTPNGIGLSPDGKVVYYAETEGARLWAIDVAGPDGAILTHPFPALGGGARFVAQAGGAYTRFDSLKVDSAGQVVVATLFNGGLSRIDPQTGAITHTPLPDRYVTNLCFAGADLKTVYVTLSSQGKLIAIDDWPVAGLRLNNQ